MKNHQRIRRLLLYSKGKFKLLRVRLRRLASMISGRDNSAILVKIK